MERPPVPIPVREISSKFHAAVRRLCYTIFAPGWIARTATCHGRIQFLIKLAISMARPNLAVFTTPGPCLKLHLRAYRKMDGRDEWLGVPTRAFFLLSNLWVPRSSRRLRRAGTTKSDDADCRHPIFHATYRVAHILHRGPCLPPLRKTRKDGAPSSRRHQQNQRDWSSAPNEEW